MAWYEGTTSVYEFPGLLARLMQSTTKEDGSPAWTLVSKNIGEPNTKDLYKGEGYVLHSTGVDGESDITIRIMPIIQYKTNDAYWNMGAEIASVGKYVPGENGENGKCYDIIESKLCIEPATSTLADFTSQQMTKLSLLRYYISIDERRVIIVAKSNRERYFNNQAMSFIAYVGEINTELPYRIKTCLASYIPPTSDGLITNTVGNGYFQGLNNNNTTLLGTVAYNSLNTNQNDSHMEGCVDVYPMGYKIQNQYIGNLDCMLYRNYHGNATFGNVLPLEGYVNVGGEEYLCIRQVNAVHSKYSPFTYATSMSNFYILIKRG